MEWLDLLRLMHVLGACVLIGTGAGIAFFMVMAKVIGSGTVGTGCGLELGKQLNDGDQMDLTIEKIGTLSNTIRKVA